jgi:hypothetical protein
LKHRCEGGYLSLPELDIGFSLPHGSVFLFDGQGLMHGVTPIRLGSDGYRYTLVYYTYDQIWKCLAPNEEMLHARKLQTERENSVVGRRYSEKFAKRYGLTEGDTDGR